MAKPSGNVKRVTTETVETVAGDPGNEIELEADTPEVSDELDAIGKLRELGESGDVRFQLRRVSPTDKAGYCATYGLDELSLDRIREEWGAGKYNIRGRRADGTFLNTAQVVIAEVPRSREQAAPAAQMGGMSDILQMMRMQQDASDKRAEMQMQLLTALITRPAPVPPALPTPPDPLAMIGALKDILKPERREDSGADAVKVLLQGIELGKGFAGGDGETGWMDMVSKGLETIPKLIQTGQPAAVASAQRVAVARVPAPQIAAPAPAQSAAPPAPVTEGNPDMNLRKLHWLNAQVKALILQASRNKDPELYAEVMLDNLPDFVTEDEIFEQLNTPDAVQQLSQLDARVLQFAAWFEAFRNACLEMLSEDAETAGEGEQPPEPLTDPADVLPENMGGGVE